MPSAMNALMLTEVKAAIGPSQSMILVDASRLKSSDNLKLRKDLRGIGARLRVAKVALLSRAVPASIAKMCEGTRSSLGVVLCEDMLTAAKVVMDLAKEDKLAVRGALMEGEPMDAATVKRISELPSKLQLRGMLVNVLAAPLASFVRVIAEIDKSKQAAEPAPAAAAPAAAPAASAPDAAPAAPDAPAAT